MTTAEEHTTFPPQLPWQYLDDTVDVELRASTYPYGAGNPGVGVQLTIESRHAERTIAIRLPEPDAMRLALAILGAMTPDPPPLEEDPVAKRLGLVPCCDSHNQHCEPPSELCCGHCTETAHDTFPTRHADGTRCVLNTQANTKETS